MWGTRNRDKDNRRRVWMFGGGERNGGGARD